MPVQILDAIATDPLKWQDLAIFKHKAPDDIVAMDVTRDSQATLSLSPGQGRVEARQGRHHAQHRQHPVHRQHRRHPTAPSAGPAPPSLEQALDKPAGTIAFTTRRQKAIHRQDRRPRRQLLVRQRHRPKRHLRDQQTRPRRAHGRCAASVRHLRRQRRTSIAGWGEAGES